MTNSPFGTDETAHLYGDGQMNRIDGGAGNDYQEGSDPIVGISNLYSKQLTDELINTLFAPNLDEAPASSFAGRVITIESEDAIPGDDGDGVAGNGTGLPFSTEQYVTTEKVSHDIGHLMDGLTVQALMVRMNNSLTAAQSGKIVEAASASTGESHELLLEKLTHAITGQRITVQRTEPCGFMVDGGSIEARRDYYTKLVSLEKAIKENPSLRFESILEKSSEAIVNLARDGDIDALAYRYALKELNPFAILGADYSIHNGNGELNLAEEGGALTRQYLADRALMLGYLSQYNLTNGQRNVDPSVPTISRVYRDVDKDVSLIVDRTSNTTPNNLLRPQIIFGWSQGLRLASDSQGYDQLHRSLTVKNTANSRSFEFAANQDGRLAA